MTIDEEAFNREIEGIAVEVGVQSLLTIPGVWDLVKEQFNNDAIQRVKEAEQEAYEREQKRYESILDLYQQEYAERELKADIREWLYENPISSLGEDAIERLSRTVLMLVLKQVKAANDERE